MRFECTACTWTSAGKYMTSHNGGCLSSLLKAVNVIIQCIRTVCTALQYIVSTANYYFFPLLSTVAIFLPFCCVSTLLLFVGMGLFAHFYFPYIGKRGEKRHKRKPLLCVTYSHYNIGYVFSQAKRAYCMGTTSKYSLPVTEFPIYKCNNV